MLYIYIQLLRPWKPQAGQYIYFYILGVSYTLFTQSHPFYISQWYYNTRGNTIIVFIIQKRGRFIRNLCLNANNSHNFKIRAIIKGLYGKELDLKLYGTVLLFAIGIKIVGQLLYIIQLLKGYYNCEVKTERIALFQELDSKYKLSYTSI